VRPNNHFIADVLLVCDDGSVLKIDHLTKLLQPVAFLRASLYFRGSASEVLYSA